MPLSFEKIGPSVAAPIIEDEGENEDEDEGSGWNREMPSGTMRAK
jgi:hypothetical protein